MEKIIFSLLVLIVISSCSQSLKNNNTQMVNTEDVELVKSFATDFLLANKSDSSYRFTDNATKELEQALTPEKQLQGYKQIANQFGDFERLEFVESVSKNVLTKMTIYRFKGYFEKSNNPLEVRVVLNKHHLIAGFWIKPWNDKLR